MIAGFCVHVVVVTFEHLGMQFYTKGQLKPVKSVGQSFCPDKRCILEGSCRARTDQCMISVGFVLFYVF